MTSYKHWDSVVRAWAAGATRSLHDDDRHAIIYALQAIDDGLMSERADCDSYAMEDA